MGTIKIADVTTNDMINHHPDLLENLIAEGFNYIRLDAEISKKYNLPDTILKIDEKGIRTRTKVDLKGLKLEFIEIKPKAKYDNNK